jgi:exostosin family protein
MHLNLIWPLAPQPLPEADWIRWLLKDFEIIEHVAPKWDLFQDNSIYVLSGPYSRPPSCFLDEVRRVRGKGLFHLSDESFTGGYEMYTNFDFVLRNYHSAIFYNPGIMMLPLGFTSNLRTLSQPPVASERKFLWSFAGEKRAARIDMINNLKNVEPYKCYLFDSQGQQPRLSRAEFKALLCDSVFSPCPMGNTVLESWRTYESLEMGCIPMVERRRWMPYYDHLMPGHPLPTFLSWRGARQFVEEMSSNQSKIVAHQQNIAEWWRSYKIKLRNDVTSFVSSGLKGSFRSSLTRDWHCRKGVNHQVWRLVELLKHASRASLQERIGITANRLIERMWSSRRG